MSKPQLFVWPSMADSAEYVVRLGNGNASTIGVKAPLNTPGSGKESTITLPNMSRQLLIDSAGGEGSILINGNSWRGSPLEEVVDITSSGEAVFTNFFYSKINYVKVESVTSDFSFSVGLGPQGYLGGWRANYNSPTWNASAQIDVTYFAVTNTHYSLIGSLLPLDYISPTSIPYQVNNVASAPPPVASVFTPSFISWDDQVNAGLLDPTAQPYSISGFGLSSDRNMWNVIPFPTTTIALAIGMISDTNPADYNFSVQLTILQQGVL